MKKRIAFTLMVITLLVSGSTGTAMAEHAGMAKVYHCPMDGHTVSAKCPHCGMKMEEKEMTDVDAQSAIEKAKEKMRGR